MPSAEAPTYYEHSKGIALGKHDPFFKWIASADQWCVDETGEVEAPVGHLALVLVDEGLVEAYRDHLGDWRTVLATEIPDFGWYIIRTDNYGIVWGIEFGGRDTLSEEGARADFAEAERVYADWLDQSAFYEGD